MKDELFDHKLNRGMRVVLTVEDIISLVNCAWSAPSTALNQTKKPCQRGDGFSPNQKLLTHKDVQTWGEMRDDKFSENQLDDAAWIAIATVNVPPLLFLSGN